MFQDVTAMSQHVSQAYDLVNVMNLVGKLRMIPS